MISKSYQGWRALTVTVKLVGLAEAGVTTKSVAPPLNWNSYVPTPTVLNTSEYSLKNTSVPSFKPLSLVVWKLAPSTARTVTSKLLYVAGKVKTGAGAVLLVVNL